MKVTTLAAISSAVVLVANASLLDNKNETNLSPQDSKSNSESGSSSSLSGSASSHEDIHEGKKPKKDAKKMDKSPKEKNVAKPKKVKPIDTDTNHCEIDLDGASPPVESPKTKATGAVSVSDQEVFKGESKGTDTQKDVDEVTETFAQSKSESTTEGEEAEVKDKDKAKTDDGLAGLSDQVDNGKPEFDADTETGAQPNSDDIVGTVAVNTNESESAKDQLKESHEAVNKEKPKESTEEETVRIEDMLDKPSEELNSTVGETVEDVPSGEVQNKLKEVKTADKIGDALNPTAVVPEASEKEDVPVPDVTTHIVSPSEGTEKTVKPIQADVKPEGQAVDLSGVHKDESTAKLDNNANVDRDLQETSGTLPNPGETEPPLVITVHSSAQPSKSEESPLEFTVVDSTSSSGESESSGSSEDSHNENGGTEVPKSAHAEISSSSDTTSSSSSSDPTSSPSGSDTTSSSSEVTNPMPNLDDETGQKVSVELDGNASTNNTHGETGTETDTPPSSSDPQSLESAIGKALKDIDEKAKNATEEEQKPPAIRLDNESSAKEQKDPSRNVPTVNTADGVSAQQPGDEKPSDNPTNEGSSGSVEMPADSTKEGSKEEQKSPKAVPNQEDTINSAGALTGTDASAQLKDEPKQDNSKPTEAGSPFDLQDQHQNVPISKVVPSAENVQNEGKSEVAIATEASAPEQKPQDNTKAEKTDADEEHASKSELEGKPAEISEADPSKTVSEGQSATTQNPEAENSTELKSGEEKPEDENSTQDGDKPAVTEQKGGIANDVPSALALDDQAVLEGQNSSESSSSPSPSSGADKELETGTPHKEGDGEEGGQNAAEQMSGQGDSANEQKVAHVLTDEDLTQHVQKKGEQNHAQNVKPEEDVNSPKGNLKESEGKVEDIKSAPQKFLNSAPLAEQEKTEPQGAQLPGQEQLNQSVKPNDLQTEDDDTSTALQTNAQSAHVENKGVADGDANPQGGAGDLVQDADKDQDVKGEGSIAGVAGDATVVNENCQTEPNVAALPQESLSSPPSPADVMNAELCPDANAADAKANAASESAQPSTATFLSDESESDANGQVSVLAKDLLKDAMSRFDIGAGNDGEDSGDNLGLAEEKKEDKASSKDDSSSDNKGEHSQNQSTIEVKPALKTSEPAISQTSTNSAEPPSNAANTTIVNPADKGSKSDEPDKPQVNTIAPKSNKSINSEKKKVHEALKDDQKTTQVESADTETKPVVHDQDVTASTTKSESKSADTANNEAAGTSEPKPVVKGTETSPSAESAGQIADSKQPVDGNKSIAPQPSSSQATGADPATKPANNKTAISVTEAADGDSATTAKSKAVVETALPDSSVQPADKPTKLNPAAKPTGQTPSNAKIPEVSKTAAAQQPATAQSHQAKPSAGTPANTSDVTQAQLVAEPRLKKPVTSGQQATKKPASSSSSSSYSSNSSSSPSSSFVYLSTASTESSWSSSSSSVYRHRTRKSKSKKSGHKKAYSDGRHTSLFEEPRAAAIQVNAEVKSSEENGCCHKETSAKTAECTNAAPRFGYSGMVSALAVISVAMLVL